MVNRVFLFLFTVAIEKRQFCFSSSCLLRPAWVKHSPCSFLCMTHIKEQNSQPVCTRSAFQISNCSLFFPAESPTLLSKCPTQDSSWTLTNTEQSRKLHRMFVRFAPFNLPRIVLIFFSTAWHYWLVFHLWSTNTFKSLSIGWLLNQFFWILNLFGWLGLSICTVSLVPLELYFGFLHIILSICQDPFEMKSHPSV